MRSQKKRLLRHELQEGMIVAASVEEPGGRLLIPTGVALTPRHLHALALWGVESVFVGSAHEENEDSMLTEAQLAAAHDMMLPRFRFCDLTHPFAAALLKSCAKHLARQSRGK